MWGSGSERGGLGLVTEQQGPELSLAVAWKGRIGREAFRPSCFTFFR